MRNLLSVAVVAGLAGPTQAHMPSKCSQILAEVHAAEKPAAEATENLPTLLSKHMRVPSMIGEDEYREMGRAVLAVLDTVVPLTDAFIAFVKCVEE